MIRWFSAAVLIAVACGGPAEPDGPPPEDAAAKSGAPSPSEPPAGDPLLAQARQQLRQGQLPEQVQAEILGSTAPEHARARRLLEAMAQPLADDEPVPEPEPAGDGVAELRAPPLAVGETEPVPAPTGTKSTKPKPDRPRTSAPAPSGQVRVGKLSMRPAKRGAQLTIGAKGPIVVGVANQLSSGIVRLIIEKAQAEGSLLSSRPRLSGAQVTAVRQGQGTIQITLRLDPGWTLGSVKSFPGGARVNLVSP